MKSLFTIQDKDYQESLKFLSKLLNVFLFSFFCSIGFIFLASYLQSLVSMAFALVFICTASCSILLWFKQRILFRNKF